MLLRARPCLGATENGDATRHLELAVSEQPEAATIRTVAAFRIVDRPALPFGWPPAKIPEDDKTFQAALAQLGVGVAHVAQVGVRAQPTRIDELATQRDRKRTRLNSSH